MLRTFRLDFRTILRSQFIVRLNLASSWLISCTSTPSAFTGVRRKSGETIRLADPLFTPANVPTHLFRDLSLSIMLHLLRQSSAPFLSFFFSFSHYRAEHASNMYVGKRVRMAPFANALTAGSAPSHGPDTRLAPIWDLTDALYTMYYQLIPVAESVYSLFVCASERRSKD